MRNVCKLIASLTEIEINKFNTVYQILVEEEPQIELDAEIMTKKLIERGVSAYDEETEKSQILTQVQTKLIGNLEDLIQQTVRDLNFG